MPESDTTDEYDWTARCYRMEKSPGNVEPLYLDAPKGIGFVYKYGPIDTTGLQYVGDRSSIRRTPGMKSIGTTGRYLPELEFAYIECVTAPEEVVRFICERVVETADENPFVDLPCRALFKQEFAEAGEPFEQVWDRIADEICVEYGIESGRNKGSAGGGTTTRSCPIDGCSTNPRDVPGHIRRDH